MIKPNGDVTKLPKWAQDYITVLTREIASLTATVNAHDVADTPIRWSDGLNSTHGLPKHARVRFGVGIDWVEVGLGERGELILTGERAITLLPRSANRIEIECVDW